MDIDDITITIRAVREELEHIQKITQYNEGGDEDEESKQNGRDSGRN